MTRSELLALVFDAQDVYREFARTGKTYTKAAKVAKARRALLEYQLIKMDAQTKAAETATVKPMVSPRRPARRLY